MSKKHKKREWHIPKLSRSVKVALAMVTFVIVAVIAMGIAALVLNSQKPTDNNAAATPADLKARDERVQISERDGAIRDSAQEALNKGDVNAADNIYKQAIQSETNDTRKVQLAIQQSSVLFFAGKYDDAVTVAKQAESYSSDKFLVADWLSNLYANHHQYALAEKYYTLAGEWAGSTTNIGRQSKSYYDAQATQAGILAGNK